MAEPFPVERAAVLLIADLHDCPASLANEAHAADYGRRCFEAGANSKEHMVALAHGMTRKHLAQVHRHRALRADLRAMAERWQATGMRRPDPRNQHTYSQSMGRMDAHQGCARELLERLERDDG